MSNDKVKSHNFNVRIYENNKEKIIERINSIDNIRRYAFIYHDKDVDEEGNPVTPHTHLLINLYDTRELKTVINYFIFYINGLKQNNHVTVIDNKKGAFEYLTHINHKDKYQYNSSDIITNDDVFWSCDGETDKSKYSCIDVINDIIGGLTLRELVVKYGRDFVYHRRDYYIICEEIKAEDKYKKHLEDNDNFIIGGNNNA